MILKTSSCKKGLTLVEILVVLMILGFSFSLFFYTWNSVELYKRVRDNRRLNDLQVLDTTLKTFLLDNSEIVLGDEDTIYLSLPDSSSTCGSYNLPKIFSPFVYRCVATPSSIDGSGWIPINFSSAKFLSLSILPLDPSNNQDYFYAYQVKGNKYKITARLESRALSSRMITDGGFEPTLYEIGNYLNFPSPQSGLVAYWSFDTVTGTLAYDLSGYRNNGTLNNFNWTTTSGWVAGRVAKALAFDGSDDYVLFSNTTSLKVDRDLTVSFWLCPTNLSKGRQSIIFKHYNNEYEVIMETDGKISFYHGDGSWEEIQEPSNMRAQENKWNYIVVTRNMSDKRIRFYLNGNFIGFDDFVDLPLASNNNVYMGISTGTNFYFQGRIDEFRLYNKAISDDDVLNIYKKDEKGETGC